MLRKSFWMFFLTLGLTAGMATIAVPTDARFLVGGDCPSAPARVNAGDIAIVSDEAGQSGLNLRVQPGLGQEIIMSIPLNSSVSIIAGPKCKGGYRWYEVGFQGQDGWSAEVGPDGLYNLKPNSSSAPASNPNQGPETGTSQQPPSSDLGPDSIIGTWGGDIDCWLTFEVLKTCHIEVQIQEESGEIYLTDNALTKRGFSADVWQHGIKYGSSYCFNLYRAGNTAYPEGEECISPISSNSVGFYREMSWVEASGTLSRVGGQPVPLTTQGGAMGCEPANGKPQYGIINIGPDVFVILCGERRLVPNPVTLDALGISRDMIDNMRMSDAELTAIPRGTDIPDINRDPSGFQAFMNEYGQDIENLKADQTPSSPSDQGQFAPESFNGQAEQPAAKPDWCSWFLIGSLCNFTVKAGDLNCGPQCVVTVIKHRSDIRKWSTPYTPSAILADAQKGTQFPWNGQQQQVKVRGANDPVQAEDLVVWPQGCGGVPYETGHIGFVESVQGILITVTDSNWGKPISPTECSTRDHAQIMILSCMKFISSPYPTVTQQPADKCSKYTDLVSQILCKAGWLK